MEAALARSKPNSCTTLAIQPGSCPHDLFAYIEGYYNRQRLHSALGISLPNRQSAKPLDPVSTKSGEGHVAYSGATGDVGRYHCKGSFVNHGGDRCISFGSLRVDQAVGAEVVRLLKPLGIEAALQAIEQRTFEAAGKRRQVELSLKHARYEVAHARRQYDAVDPDNRLVASELERRWNDKLIDVLRLEESSRSLISAAHQFSTSKNANTSCALAPIWR